MNLINSIIHIYNSSLLPSLRCIVLQFSKNKRYREIAEEKLVNLRGSCVDMSLEELYHIIYGNDWPLIESITQFLNEALWFNRSLHKESETLYSVGSWTFSL